MMFAAATFAVVFLSPIIASASPVDGAGGASTTPAMRGMPSVKGLLDKNNLPTTGQEWISLGDKSASGLEYQPNDFGDEDPETARRLRAIRDRALLSWGTDEDYSKQFINGGETYYDEYAQAWRLLGFYIDCESPYEDEGDCGGGGGAEDNQEAVQYDENGNVVQVQNCVRYLLWAAYIDLDYQGEGIGEYQFFDRHTGEWDKSSCIAESGRCAKYDCHLSDSNFKLLGLFKEPNYHSWMEQLYKHEGVCVWTEDEYHFMQYTREAWPCGCTQTSQTDENGNYIYYDMKPLPEGRMTFGLYTDASCSTEYSGDLNAVEVIENMYAYGYNNNDDEDEDDNDRDDKGTISDLAAALTSWNDAFDVFKKCQPCKAYDLSNDGSVNYNQDDHHEDDDGNSFACHDDAGYNSVNQCMKFRTKTKMLTANFRDVALASAQGTITEIKFLGFALGQGGFGRYGKFLSSVDFSTGALGISRKSTTWLVSSLVVFAVLLVGFIVTRKAEKRAEESSAREPLVSK